MRRPNPIQTIEQVTDEHISWVKNKLFAHKGDTHISRISSILAPIIKQPTRDYILNILQERGIINIKTTVVSRSRRNETSTSVELITRPSAFDTPAPSGTERLEDFL